jgi:predicted DNA-binding protein
MEASNQLVRTTIEGRVKEIEHLSFDVPKMKETDAQIESTSRDKVRRVLGCRDEDVC